MCFHAWVKPLGCINEGEGRHTPKWQDLWTQIRPLVELNILQSFCSHIPNVLGAQPRIRNSSSRTGEQKKKRNHFISFSLRKKFYDQGLKTYNFNFHDTFLGKFNCHGHEPLEQILPEEEKYMNFILSFKVRRIRSIIFSFSLRQIKGIGSSFFYSNPSV